eukprot:scaffold1284_cov353-Prasinococcus_capsulatus_cf.AAC.1
MGPRGHREPDAAEGSAQLFEPGGVGGSTAAGRGLRCRREAPGSRRGRRASSSHHGRAAPPPGGQRPAASAPGCEGGAPQGHPLSGEP